MKPNIRIVSLFSGVGGLDFGFAKAGCEIVFANDFNRFACETYRHNFKCFFKDDSNHLVEGDINKCANNIPMRADLLLAGAPCQSWSMAGNRKGFDDPRGQLLFKTIEILSEKQPRFFILENVVGLINHNKGRSFKIVLEKIGAAGYEIFYSTFDFSEYGVDQRRKRVLIWGKRTEEPVLLHSLIPAKSSTSPGQLGTLLRQHKHLLVSHPNHNIVMGSKLYKSFGPILRQGENVVKLEKDEINKRLTAKGHEPTMSVPGGFRPVYRLCPFEIAPTMVFNAGTNVPWHPWDDRCISVREAAIIQGFPVDFEFKGTTTEQYKQVANAVPPRISVLLAEKFVSVFQNHKP